MKNLRFIRAKLPAAAAAALALAIAWPLASAAQPFPNRPVKVIVPYAPGGAPDALMRILAQPFAESTGQQLVVENRPGAGNLIGSQAAAQAAPDGYTLLAVDSSLYSINPHLSEKFPLDIKRDFTPITLAVDTPIVLAVNTSLGVDNLRDFLALAGSKPEMPYGSAGPGTAHHLAMEIVAQLGGVKLTHVPYRGSGQSIPAVVAGDVVAAFGGPTAIVPHVRAGKLKILGMTAEKRSRVMPDIPPLAEAGLPGYAMRNNIGILGPGGMTPDVVKKLNEEFVKALNRPEVRARLAELGQDAVGSTPEQFSELIRVDLDYYEKLIKQLNIKISN